MPSPEGRLTAPGPMEQLPPGQALTFINAWGEEFDAAEPPAYAVVYAGEVCDDMTTAPLHPSHEVVDASLDLFARIAKRLKSPNVRNSILNGVGYAIDRPDGHGAGRVSDILDVISEGYVGIGPATNPGEPSNFGAIKEYASHLRYHAFLNGRDYRIHRERKIKEAGEELGTDTSQQERMFNLVEHFADTGTSKDRTRFFIAAARMALGREERRQILGAVTPLDSVSEEDLGQLWMTHHVYFPTDLLGGVPMGRKLFKAEDPKEAVIGYLIDMDQSVETIVDAVRRYQETAFRAKTDAQDEFLASLDQEQE